MGDNVTEVEVRESCPGQGIIQDQHISEDQQRNLSSTLARGKCKVLEEARCLTVTPLGMQTTMIRLLGRKLQLPQPTLTSGRGRTRRTTSKMRGTRTPTRRSQRTTNQRLSNQRLPKRSSDPRSPFERLPRLRLTRT